MKRDGELLTQTGQILYLIERNYEFTFEEFVRLQLLAANQIQAIMSVREESDSHVRSFVMSKRTNHIPPALKHGIYSGIGLLPTEDPVEFQKFKHEIFDEYAPVGRSER